MLHPLQCEMTQIRQWDKVPQYGSQDALANIEKTLRSLRNREKIHTEALVKPHQKDKQLGSYGRRVLMQSNVRIFPIGKVINILEFSSFRNNHLISYIQDLHTKQTKGCQSDDTEAFIPSRFRGF